MVGSRTVENIGIVSPAIEFVFHARCLVRHVHGHINLANHFIRDVHTRFRILKANRDFNGANRHRSELEKENKGL